MLLAAIVLWLHIFSAIGWLGALMFFAMVVRPGLSGLSAQSRGEFIIAVFPRYVKYLLSFAAMTLILGIATLVVFTNGHSSMMSPSTAFGAYISTGAILALIALAVGLGVAIPSANKMVNILKSMTTPSGPPPPELKAAAERMRIGSTVSMILLILVTVMMVAGATL